MGFQHGRLARLFVDSEAAACQNVTATVTSITFNRSINNPETTAMGDNSIQRDVAGLRDATLDFSFIFNHGTGGCPVEILDGMYSGCAVRRVQYAPACATGSPVYTASMRMNNFSYTSPVDGVITGTANFELASGSVASALIS